MGVAVGILSVVPSNASIESLLPAVARIVGFIRRRNRLSPDEAEEFDSFVKLKLVERSDSILNGFRGRSTLETYLSVVVQRLFLDFRGGRKSKSLPLSSVTDEAVAVPVGDPAVAREDQAAAERIQTALESALEKLETQDRLIVRLHFFEGLSVASVASVLGLPQKPLYRRIDRVLESLRVQLESAGVDPKRILALIGRAEFGVGLHKNPTAGVGKRTDDSSMES